VSRSTTRAASAVFSAFAARSCSRATASAKSPDARLLYLDGSGHNAYQDEPERYMAGVRELFGYGMAAEALDSCPR
jgi:pimeloyl-ACP methyl ester carboxylesterase